MILAGLSLRPALAPLPAPVGEGEHVPLFAAVMAEGTAASIEQAVVEVVKEAGSVPAENGVAGAIVIAAQIDLAPLMQDVASSAATAFSAVTGGEKEIPVDGGPIDQPALRRKVKETAGDAGPPELATVGPMLPGFAPPRIDAALPDGAEGTDIMSGFVPLKESHAQPVETAETVAPAEEAEERIVEKAARLLDSPGLSVSGRAVAARSEVSGHVDAEPEPVVPAVAGEAERPAPAVSPVGTGSVDGNRFVVDEPSRRPPSPDVLAAFGARTQGEGGQRTVVANVGAVATAQALATTLAKARPDFAGQDGVALVQAQMVTDTSAVPGKGLALPERKGADRPPPEPARGNEVQGEPKRELRLEDMGTAPVQPAQRGRHDQVAALPVAFEPEGQGEPKPSAESVALSSGPVMAVVETQGDRRVFHVVAEENLSVVHAPEGHQSHRIVGTDADAGAVSAKPLPGALPAVQMILQAALSQPDGPLLLTLTPDDLGAVRFEMHGRGDTIHVNLTVERPDTLDMLRRHVDQLASELRQAGFAGASFSFSGAWGGGQERGARQTYRDGGEQPDDIAPNRQPRATGSGLDLRL